MARFLSLTKHHTLPSVFVAEREDWWVASERAFGGQIVAHCLTAAGRVSPFPHAHSLHVLFVAASRMSRTLYEVSVLREGKTFALFAVRAREESDGQIIATATVGFQAIHPKDGLWEGELLHAPAMPLAPPPSECAPATMEAWADSKAEGLDSMCWEVRPVAGSPYLCWVAWRGGARPQPLIEGSPVEQAAALGFLSDLQFLWAAYWPHAASHTLRMITSLDHSVYFHSEDLGLSEWLLFSLTSPSAGSQRALVLGSVWAADGSLVASIVQEGVLRVLRRSLL